jgi:hypothetical protein
MKLMPLACPVHSAEGMIIAQTVLARVFMYYALFNCALFLNYVVENGR